MCDIGSLVLCENCGQLLETERGESARDAAHSHVAVHYGDEQHPRGGQMLLINFEIDEEVHRLG